MKIHAQVTKHGEIKLILTWKHYTYWLAFLVLEEAMYNIGRENDNPSHPAVYAVNYNNDLPNKICLLVQ